MMRLWMFLTLSLLLVPTLVSAQSEDSGAEAAAEVPAVAEEPAQEPAVQETEMKLNDPVATEEASPKAAAQASAVSPLVAPAVQSEATAFKIAFDGYLRVEVTTIVPDRFFGISMPSSDANPPNVGRNDGMVLGDARLNLRATYGDNLYVRLGFDGAVAHYDDDNASVGSLTTALKDAYMRYTFGASTQVYVGRFKPPYDMEGLTSVADQQFVHRSVESRGVQRHEGYWADMEGMAPGRQLGIMVADNALITTDIADFGYALAVTNGNAGDATVNDNDLPALYLRLGMAWGKALGAGDEEGPATQAQMSNGGTMGLSYFINQLTSGDAPDRHQRRVMGAGLDVNVHYSGFTLQGQVLWTDTTYLRNPADFNEQALGGHAQVAYEILDGLELGYRLGFYDPRFVSPLEGDTVDTSAYDQVIHHTAGLRYRCAELPIIFMGEYTHAAESASRLANNDRAEGAIQVTF